MISLFFPLSHSLILSRQSRFSAAPLARVSSGELVLRYCHPLCPFPPLSHPQNLAIIYLSILLLRILFRSCFSCFSWNLAKPFQPRTDFPRKALQKKKEEIDRSLDCRQPNTINPNCLRAPFLSLLSLDTLTHPLTNFSLSLSLTLSPSSHLPPFYVTFLIGSFTHPSRHTPGTEGVRRRTLPPTPSSNKSSPPISASLVGPCFSPQPTPVSLPPPAAIFCNRPVQKQFFRPAISSYAQNLASRISPLSTRFAFILPPV